MSRTALRLQLVRAVLLSVYRYFVFQLSVISCWLLRSIALGGFHLVVNGARGEIWLRVVALNRFSLFGVGAQHYTVRERDVLVWHQFIVIGF